MGRLVAWLVLASALQACAHATPPADPASDAPEARIAPAAGSYVDAPSYREALARWHGPEDVNAWIGGRFEYDMARALQLSETQRTKTRMPILAPDAFFGAPRGVCVDLARFGVETLRVLRPETKPRYVMIEFDPVSIAGNTLRRHWVVAFERDGAHYFFADSKRPGHLAGPYASTRAYLDEYAAYRGRRIVAFREVDTYEKKMRTPAAKQARGDGAD